MLILERDPITRNIRYKYCGMLDFKTIVSEDLDDFLNQMKKLLIEKRKGVK